MQIRQRSGACNEQGVRLLARHDSERFPASTVSNPVPSTLNQLLCNYLGDRVAASDRNCDAIDGATRPPTSASTPATRSGDKNGRSRSLPALDQGMNARNVLEGRRQANLYGNSSTANRIKNSSSNYQTEGW